MSDLGPLVRRLYDDLLPQWEEYTQTLPGVAPLVRAATEGLPQELRLAFYNIALALEQDEPCFCELGPPEATQQYLKVLKLKAKHLADPVRCTASFYRTLHSLFTTLTPKGLSEGAALFHMPLWATVEDIGLTIERMFHVLREPQREGRSLFLIPIYVYEENVCQAAGVTWGTVEFDKVPGPSKSKLSPRAIVDTYLRHTPFHEIFQIQVPVPLGERSAHHLIIGGAGSGKTSMMEKLLLHDFTDETRPGVVLIDPHTDLVNRIVNADLGLDDRIIYVNYRDIDHPPQINIFAPNTRMQQYDRAMKEQVSAGVIETFEYLFTGLFNLALTGRQATLFRYLARLMLTFPETMGRPATIRDMLDLTDEKKIGIYQKAIAALPDVQREFFERDYIPAFKDTRQQIRGRLQALLDSPTLDRLLSSSETKIDLFAELNRGSIILVDTAAGFLGSDGAAVVGRLWISLIFQAVLERQAIPEGKRRPTYLYIDEALTFAFDEKMASLLRETRKYGCGAILASQELPQNATVRSALSANTAIKMVCRPSSSDAGALAPDMRTTKEFILAQPQLQFATYAATLPSAVPIQIKPGTFANLPKRDPAAFIERNRARVSGQYQQMPTVYAQAAEEGTPYEPPEDDEMSRKW